MSEPAQVPVDPERVIANLTQELASAIRQRAELWAAVEALREQVSSLQAELGNHVTGDGAS